MLLSQMLPPVILPPKSILPYSITARNSADIRPDSGMSFLMTMELGSSMIGPFAPLDATDKATGSSGLLASAARRQGRDTYLRGVRSCVVIFVIVD